MNSLIKFTGFEKRFYGQSFSLSNILAKYEKAGHRLPLRHFYAVFGAFTGMRNCV